MGLNLPQPVMSQAFSVRLQDEVRQLAREKQLPTEVINVFLPDVNTLFENAENCSNLAADVAAINYYHNRVLKHPEMLDKLVSDWYSFNVGDELKKILDADRKHKNEANRMLLSFKRTQIIAESIRLNKRCIDEKLLNYNMKYYRDKMGNIHDYEDIRSLAPSGSRTPFLLSSEEAVVTNGEDEDDVAADHHHEDESEDNAPDTNLPFPCHGNNRRRLKHFEIYLIGSDTGFDETRHSLQYERHEIANRDTQYGALLAEMLHTGNSRSFDLEGDHHCWNRSYYAPVFDHFDDPEKSKASCHCSAIILLPTEPLVQGTVGINADYSMEFGANCFLKNVRIFRAAKRNSGMRFTHDVIWLLFEHLLRECRRKQGVKDGEHFIPDVAILSGLAAPKGTSGQAACNRWKTIATGEKSKGHAKPQLWQIQSLKKLGIHLGDNDYMSRLQEDRRARESDSAASLQVKLSASNKNRWGKGNKSKKQKTNKTK
jgi:hypothetical protein